MSQSFDEYCDVWCEANIKARKPHKCMACKETIQPGQTYIKVDSLYDGDWNHVIRCARCQAIWKHLNAKEEARGCSYTQPDPTLNCGHSYEEVWKATPPPEIAALAFALPGEVSL